MKTGIIERKNEKQQKLTSSEHNRRREMARDTTVNDLPDVILSNIFASVSDTRTRNSLSLACRKFMLFERATRSSLTLRGNARDLFLLPNCFRSVTRLDLSLLSPWGHALFTSPPSDPLLLARRLAAAFPAVTSLTVYARSPSTLHLLAPQWPKLESIKLVRWHQRPPGPPGADLAPLFEHCRSLTSLDLSSFYYWTEDLPPVLESHPAVATNLTRLDLLTTSFSEGFKAQELRSITAACPNLKELLAACTFDPRYIGFVGDEDLLAIASNCPNLRLLHLADTAALSTSRGDPDPTDEGEDARISRATLVSVAAALPRLEELALDVCKNVRESGLALEELSSRCPGLRSVKLSRFHGVCAAVEWQLDGIARCHNLQALSIKDSADLTDMGLIAIARGCSRLARFEVEGCRKITGKGLRTLASLLHRTLVDVRISCCKNLDAGSSVRALEPVSHRLERLHIDCVWEELEEGAFLDINLNELAELGVSGQETEFLNFFENTDYEHESKKKKLKCSAESTESTNEDSSYGNGFWCNKTWKNLRCLSLWISVGELLIPLTMGGLEDCPNLEEIHIKVEGDCRGRRIPAQPAFGLSSLAVYPRLTKMQLDCRDVIGFALTAPSGQIDLSLWERFYLNGIGLLTLTELDYWPPQDRDVNQRTLSQPAAGLLAQCDTLRKLFIHGTAHEHFMMFLLKIPYLRDMQLREDYYPAPADDMSTEMRVGSCSRFEDRLNSPNRPILD